MYKRHSYIRFHEKTGMLILIFMLFFTGYSIAQADRKLIRQGNREYEKTRYSESEIFYRKAIDKNEESADAVFNSGDALYKQKKYEDAGKQFIETHKMNENKVKKSASLYNLGNSFLMANKLQESIEAYKNSLKLKPDNPEAKYNLAYAQDLLRKQQQEQQQQQQNKDNRDQEKKEQEQKQDDQEKQKDDKQQKQQDQQSISKEDAERLLNAIANDEKNVQEKVKLAKAAKAKVKTLKNW